MTGSEFTSVSQSGTVRFRRIRLLGTGGVAEVWLAFDRWRREQVAIKVLRPQYANHEGLLRRFRREAGMIAALDSPHIVRLHSLEEDDSAPLLVMEYVPGADLKTLLALDGPMEPTHALRLLRQIASGIAVAHRAGLVHRDIKPANILMTHDGIPKITDFGIAHEIAGAQMTDPQQAWGTSAYLAPEQATGQPVSPATDIYSLGILLFEMLTGRVPFAGDDPVQVALAHIQKPTPSVHTIDPLIPPGIEQLVARMMSKAPEARPQDGDALVRVLDRYIEGSDSPTTVYDKSNFVARRKQPVTPERAAPVTRPSRWRWIIPILTLLLVGAGYVVAQGWVVPTEVTASVGTQTPKGIALLPTATLTPTPTPTPTRTPTPLPSRREGNGTDAIASQREAPIRIDGDRGEWGTTPWIPVEYVTHGREAWSGPADLSGTVSFAWDRDQLYVAVERRDESHVQRQQNNELFRGDVVELWLDVDVSGDYDVGEVNGDDFQIILSPGDFSAIRAEASVPYPSPHDAERIRLVQVRAIPQPDGYTLEAAIPWLMLDVLPRPGLTLGVAVVFSDFDDGESSDAESQLTTTPRPPFLNPDAFGNLLLLDE